MGVLSMNAGELRDRADQVAENAFLKLIGRIGMATAFPVLIAGMTWLGSTLWQINSEIAKQAGRIDLLNERIELRMGDSYTGTDARHDQELTSQRFKDQRGDINDNKAAINENRQRIRKLEGNRFGGPH